MYYVYDHFSNLLLTVAGLNVQLPFDLEISLISWLVHILQTIKLRNGTTSFVSQKVELENEDEYYSIIHNVFYWLAKLMDNSLDLLISFTDTNEPLKTFYEITKSILEVDKSIAKAWVKKACKIISILSKYNANPKYEDQKLYR